MKSPANPGRGGEADGIKQGELFDPPSFSPTYPPPATLTAEALTLLLSGRELTHPVFECITKSWRLSEMIRALRSDYGWPIDTIAISAPTTERPDRFIAKYILPEWVRKEVGCIHG